MTQPAFSIYQLVSPQQLMRLRQQPAPMPQLPSPNTLQQFSRVSALVGGDRLQLQQPASTPTLANPLSLFQQRPSLPAISPGSPAASPAAPAVNIAQLRHRASLDELKTMKPAELKELGESNKKAFFEALLPAAIESEKEFGVPAEVTLAQAALESGWARSPIGGYNIFGIKGNGPAGKVTVTTKEFLRGKWVTIQDGFAKYNNFSEAVQRHGKLFHNGYYDKAVNQYARDKNAYAFIDNIQGIYATDPKYSEKIKDIIETHGLTQMVNRTGIV